MAKEIENKNTCEYQGPTQAADGLPPNPSDEIFAGKALPVVQPVATTQRRAFTEVTKAPRFVREGQGPDAARISTGVGERSS